MAESGHSTAWNELDVAVAHLLVLEELLGLSARCRSLDTLGVKHHNVGLKTVA